MNTRRAMVCAALLLPRVVSADPPPKVCVAVVGDPDEAVRALADDVGTRVGASDALRGVADADSRAALRGEPSVPTGDLTVARRGLRGTDGDVAGLRALADQLGCAWFVELGARPAGTLVRVVHVLSGEARANEVRPTVDAADVVALVQRMIAMPAALPSPAADGGAPPTGDASVTDASVADASVADASVARAATAVTQRPAERPLLARIWPWLVVGGIVLAGAVVAILVAPQPETQTRLTIVNPGAQ